MKNNLGDNEMKTHKIKCLQELFDFVRDINSDNNYWFRGHADSDYILSPSAYRNIYVVADQFDRPVEPRKLETFDNHGDKILLLDKIYLASFLQELCKNNIAYDTSLNTVDLYCLAQHYGVWTPMLDWTTDFSVALFFACDGRRENTDCSVFFLEPQRWNEMITGYKKIFTSDEVKEISNLDPLAMYGKKWDKRMCRQSGNFTAHGNIVWPLERYNPDDETLIKIIIPSNVADELEVYMKCFGITHDSIYVDKDEKDEISKSLKGFNERKLKELLEEYKDKWEKTPKENRGVSRHLL